VPGVFIAIVVPMVVKIDKPDPSLLKGADYLGMALMAVFLGCLQYTLEEGPRWNWFSDDTIRMTAWISGSRLHGGRSPRGCKKLKSQPIRQRRHTALGAQHEIHSAVGLAVRLSRLHS
jgi:MFS transporter, DHA2 family, multidrug resistance protein